MPQEIEAKMRVTSHDAVRERLNALAAERVSYVLELNTFFDTPDRKLLSHDSGLRLRGVTPIDGGEAKIVVTLKGPKQPGRVKVREETEMTVDDEAAAVAIFETMGYRAVLSFEKKRETFRLDDCLVELDELPHLGRFVEVEGPSEAAVDKVRERLGMSDAAMEPEGYASIIRKWLDASGRTSPVRFPR